MTSRYSQVTRRAKRPAANTVSGAEEARKLREALERLEGGNHRKGHGSAFRGASNLSWAERRAV